MSVTKYTAGVSAPDGASEGVSPAANQNTMICIGFVEIEVYGKEGANWVLVGTTTADDKVVFVPFTTYSEVFFKSNSGQEEQMRGVFMEDSLIQAVAPAPSAIADVSDMPAFTSSDAGKVLSVDNSGNLVWITR